MSHFTVMVIGEDPEGQLAPYQENNMGDCPREYLEFHNSEDDPDEGGRWNDPEAGVEMVVLKVEGDHPMIRADLSADIGPHLHAKDGDVYAVYDDQTIHVASQGEFMVVTWSKLFEVDNPDAEHPFDRKKKVVPEDAERRHVPFRALYGSFDEFMTDWCGYSKRDEETGKYGYWENPNCKWDWYQLGGRWNGFFRVTQEVENAIKRAVNVGGDPAKLDPEDLAIISNLQLGSPGLMTERPDDFRVDACRKRHIDVERMRNDAGEAAANRWDENTDTIAQVQTLLLQMKERGFNYSWPDLTEDERTAYRVLTHNSEVPSMPPKVAMGLLNRQWGEGMYALVKQYNQLTTELEFRHGISDDDLKGTREDYIQKARDNAITSFAVLKDGEWHERGSMGWFGCVSGENDNWSAQFAKLFDELPDDTPVAVYDCHI